MISISLLLALRKTPRVLNLILIFVTMFLLSFLLMGCTKTSSSYSNIYLIEFEFNSSSTMFPLIESAYKIKGNQELSGVKVRANYLGLCTELNQSIACSDKSDVSPFKDVSGVSFFDSSSNSTSTTMDLIKIAKEYSEHVVKPYVLVATLVLNIFLFLGVLYCTLKFLPFTEYLKKFCIILCPVTNIVWGFGCMWNHIATNSSIDLVLASSMYMVRGKPGPRAQALTWCSFALMLVTALNSIFLFIRDRRNLLKEQKLAQEKQYPRGTL